MNKYSNQKTIAPDTETVRAEKPYAILPYRAIEDAANNLNGNAYKLWMYFAIRTIPWGYSQTDICQKTGMSADGAKKAFDELVAAGYLTTSNGVDYKFHILTSKYSAMDIDSIFDTSEKEYTFTLRGPVYTMKEDDIREMLMAEGHDEDKIEPIIRYIKEKGGNK